MAIVGGFEPRPEKPEEKPVGQPKYSALDAFYDRLRLLRFTRTGVAYLVISKGATYSFNILPDAIRQYDRVKLEDADARIVKITTEVMDDERNTDHL